MLDGNLIKFYDGIITVYSGGEKAANIKSIILTERDEPISLNDCLKLVKRVGTVTVVFEDLFHGNIYRYGNRGEIWEHVGETCGYA